MSNFRGAQNKAHPKKTNTIMTGIIVLQILFISMQIWFLFGALNNALEGNIFFATTTFVGSLLMAIASFAVLRYLPEPLMKRFTNAPRKKGSKDQQ
jgi:ABC-type transport system involved in cytochrome bd biosynthesis fused ATPase/permease subunit